MTDLKNSKGRFLSSDICSVEARKRLVNIQHRLFDLIHTRDQHAGVQSEKSADIATLVQSQVSATETTDSYSSLQGKRKSVMQKQWLLDASLSPPNVIPALPSVPAHVSTLQNPPTQGQGRFDPQTKEAFQELKDDLWSLEVIVRMWEESCTLESKANLQDDEQPNVDPVASRTQDILVDNMNSLDRDRKVTIESVPENPLNASSSRQERMNGSQLVDQRAYLRPKQRQEEPLTPDSSFINLSSEKDTSSWVASEVDYEDPSYIDYEYEFERSKSYTRNGTFLPVRGESRRVKKRISKAVKSIMKTVGSTMTFATKSSHDSSGSDKSNSTFGENRVVLVRDEDTPVPAARSSFETIATTHTDQDEKQGSSVMFLHKGLDSTVSLFHLANKLKRSSVRDSNPFRGNSNRTQRPQKMYVPPEDLISPEDELDAIMERMSRTQKSEKQAYVRQKKTPSLPHIPENRPVSHLSSPPPSSASSIIESSSSSYRASDSAESCSSSQLRPASSIYTAPDSHRNTFLLEQFDYDLDQRQPQVQFYESESEDDDDFV